MESVRGVPCTYNESNKAISISAFPCSVLPFPMLIFDKAESLTDDVDDVPLQVHGPGGLIFEIRRNALRLQAAMRPDRSRKLVAE